MADGGSRKKKANKKDQEGDTRMRGGDNGRNYDNNAYGSELVDGTNRRLLTCKTLPPFVSTLLSQRKRATKGVVDT